MASISDVNEPISEENVRYLNSLSYVSIHAPFIDDSRNEVSYGSNELTRELLLILSDVYRRIGAKSIVFHPTQIADFSVFSGCDMNICLENLDEEEGRPKEAILDSISNEKYRLVLDAAHALASGVGFLDELVDRYGQRVQHVHLSDRRFNPSKNRVGNHQQLLFCEDMDKFKRLKDIDCPIIIEVSIKDKIGDIVNLEKEISFVKKYFESGK